VALRFSLELASEWVATLAVCTDTGIISHFQPITAVRNGVSGCYRRSLHGKNKAGV
jgi:hypothetical protein